MLLCGTFFPPQVRCSIPCCFTYTANIVLPEWVDNILWTDTLLFLHTCSQSLITTPHKTTRHPQHIKIHHQKWMKANEMKWVPHPGLSSGQPWGREAGVRPARRTPPLYPLPPANLLQTSLSHPTRNSQNQFVVAATAITYSFYDINIRQMCIILHLFMCFL